MCAQHIKLFARTVLVKNNEVESAYRSLEKILRNDRVLERARRGIYYEKPHQYRRRVSMEKCRRVYDAEMARKISFVMKTYRPSPWPR